LALRCRRQELRNTLAKSPGADPIATWTNQIIGANSESEVLAFVEGLLILSWRGHDADNSSCVLSVVTYQLFASQDHRACYTKDNQDSYVYSLPYLLLPLVFVVVFGPPCFRWGRRRWLASWTIDLGRIPWPRMVAAEMNRIRKQRDLAGPQGGTYPRRSRACRPSHSHCGDAVGRPGQHCERTCSWC